MPERIIRPRRPIGWTALLRKGHVHQSSKSSQRRDDKIAVDDAAVEAWYARHDPESKDADDP